MSRITTYSWSLHREVTRNSVAFARLDGTDETGETGETGVYPFGDRLSGSGGPRVALGGFYIAIVPTFQGFWKHVMGSDGNPAVNQTADDLPVEKVS